MKLLTGATKYSIDFKHFDQMNGGCLLFQAQPTELGVTK